MFVRKMHCGTGIDFEAKKMPFCSMFDSRVSDPALDEKYAPTLGIFWVPEAARNGDMVFEALITIIFF